MAHNCDQHSGTFSSLLFEIGSSHGSRPSSRASSRSSRPPSVCSDVSEEGGPEVFTTMQTETRVLGGRPTTTVTYQTHQTQTRTITHPTHTSARSSTAGSRIPKPGSGTSSGQSTPTGSLKRPKKPSSRSSDTSR